MLSLQTCALIWNCNYSCWSSLVHIITWDWILGFLIAKIRSWSQFASAVFSDPDWNIDRPSAPNGQHQEEVGHQNLSCHWKRLTWLQAGRKNICCKFALAVLLTIISKEPFSYKSEGVLFATSVRWLLRSFAPFEQHLSLWSCSVFVTKCTCLFFTIWTPSVWHPAEPPSTKRWKLHCEKNCEEVMGLLWDGSKMLDTKAGTRLCLRWAWYPSLDNGNRLFLLKWVQLGILQARMMWGKTHMIYLIAHKALGTK